MRHRLSVLLVCLCALFLVAPGGWPAPCVWPDDCGGSGGHGASGNTGTWDSILYLLGLKNVPMYVEDGGPYYFGDTNATGDFAASSNTNDCLSPSTPCTDYWKLWGVAPGSDVILDAGDAQWMTWEVCVDQKIGLNVPQDGNHTLVDMLVDEATAAVGHDEIDVVSAAGGTVAAGDTVTFTDDTDEQLYWVKEEVILAAGVGGTIEFYPNLRLAPDDGDATTIADGVCDVDAETAVGYEFAAEPVFWEDRGATGVGNSDMRMRISSSRPGTQVEIDMTDAPAMLSLFHVQGGGTIVLQDIDFTGFTKMIVISESSTTPDPDGTRLIMNNVSCTGQVDQVCFYAAGGHFISLNSSASSAADEPLVMVAEDGQMTWISQKVLEATTRTTENGVILVSSGNQLDVPPQDGAALTIIGPVLRHSGNDPGDPSSTKPPFISMWTAGTSTGGSTLRAARVIFDAAEWAQRDACVGLDNPDPCCHLADIGCQSGPGIRFLTGPTEWQDIEVHQSTFLKTMPAFEQAAGNEGSQPNQRIISKYNVYQLGTHMEVGPFQSIGGILNDAEISFRDSLVDEEGGANTNFLYVVTENEDYVYDNLVADMVDKLTSGTYSEAFEAAYADFFQNGIEVTDDDSFSGTCPSTHEMVAGPHACVCDTDADCYDKITTPYRIEAVAPLPKELGDWSQDIRYFRLGEVHTNYGAD